jgi:hypothetical protein
MGGYSCSTVPSQFQSQLPLGAALECHPVCPIPAATGLHPVQVTVPPFAQAPVPVPMLHGLPRSAVVDDLTRGDRDAGEGGDAMEGIQTLARGAAPDLCCAIRGSGDNPTGVLILATVLRDLISSSLLSSAGSIGIRPVAEILHPREFPPAIGATRYYPVVFC